MSLPREVLIVPVGYECRAIPEGWRGPYVLAAGATPPSCAAPFVAVAVDGHDQLQAPPAACDCSCGPLSGGSSFSATVKVGDTCGAGTSYTISQSCTVIGGTGTAISPLTVSGSRGSCAPSAGPQKDVTWSRTVRACGASADLPVGGCGGAGRCAPPVPGGFEAGHCIAHDGDEACPADYPNKQTAYLGVKDARTCSGCKCEPPEPMVTVYKTNTGCAELDTGSDRKNATLGGCYAGPIKSARIETGGGGCTAMGGTPAGTANPAEQVTICCAGPRSAPSGPK